MAVVAFQGTLGVADSRYPTIRVCWSSTRTHIRVSVSRYQGKAIKRLIVSTGTGNKTYDHPLVKQLVANYITGPACFKFTFKNFNRSTKKKLL